MIWWGLGIIAGAALVYLSVRTDIHARLGNRRGAAPDDELVKAEQDAMRDIDRGRAAGQGMIPF
ncbi:MAG: hypothetical protein B7X41_08400 [Microbacterium sp. 14-71-5]|nr:MAG: hypothetical protein B7X41_08400 [Microbacterium sp. 14-71-5]